MTALTIIFGVLLFLLIGFLFTPVFVYIDTNERRYEILHSPVFRLSIRFKDFRIIPRLKLLGMKVPLASNKKLKDSPAKPAGKRRKRSGRNKSIRAWKFLIEQSIKSFKIKKAEVDVDMGDVVLNAELIPVFLLATSGQVKLITNFEGRTYFHLEVITLPAKLFWIAFQFLTKK